MLTLNEDNNSEKEVKSIKPNNSNGKARKVIVSIFTISFIIVALGFFISGLIDMNIALIIISVVVFFVVFMLAPKLAGYGRKGKIVLRTVIPLLLVIYSFIGYSQHTLTMAATQKVTERFVDFKMQNPGNVDVTKPFHGKFIFYNEKTGKFDPSSHGIDRYWSINTDDITVIIAYEKSTNHVGTYYSENDGKKTGEAYRIDYTLTVYNAINGQVLDERTFQGDQPPIHYNKGNYTGTNDLATGEVNNYINRLFAESSSK